MQCAMHGRLLTGVYRLCGISGTHVRVDAWSADTSPLRIKSLQFGLIAVRIGPNGRLHCLNVA